MLKRLTSILLLLAVGAGVASGAPLHPGGRGCSVGEAVEMMDCCEFARLQGDTPEILAARLCCAVNCQTTGANGPTFEARLSPPRAAPSHPAAMPTPIHLSTQREHRLTRSSNANESPPVYLLNLAFLI
jgi:hypothetical protein